MSVARAVADKLREALEGAAQLVPSSTMRLAAVLLAAMSTLLGCGSEVQREGSGGGRDDGTGGHGTGTGDTAQGAGGGDASCSGSGAGEIVRTGGYFFLLDPETPLPTQLQLLAWLEVDANGFVTGQFTNADRIPGPTCGCPDTEACSSVDPEGCVAPSTKAGTEDEYADFLVAKPDPPEGYGFTTSGCAVDQADGTGLFAPAPADIAIEQPEVTFIASLLTVRCAVDAAGALRCEGSFQADDVRLGTTSSGPGSGTLRGIRIPDDQVPPDLPRP